MLKIIKITFYIFFVLVLLEAVLFVRNNYATIGTSMEQMESDFVNTAQEILNEGNVDVNNSLNTINF